jgi:hypothetical protein
MGAKSLSRERATLRPPGSSRPVPGWLQSKLRRSEKNRQKRGRIREKALLNYLLISASREIPRAEPL